MPFEISLSNVLKSLFIQVFQMFTQTKRFLDKKFTGGFLFNTSCLLKIEIYSKNQDPVACQRWISIKGI